jgi:hypothetical protein
MQKVLLLHLSEGTEESHETCQFGWPASGPEFELGTSRIRSESSDHSVTMFNNKLRTLACGFAIFQSTRLLRSPEDILDISKLYPRPRKQNTFHNRRTQLLQKQNGEMFPSQRQMLLFHLQLVSAQRGHHQVIT